MGFFRNIVDKFKQGLQKTREAVVTGVQGLRNILSGRKLDEELINEIERRLLQADVGVKTTAKLIDGLRADFRSGTMENGDQALEYLKREIAALWPAQDRSLRLAPAGERPSVILMTGVNGVGKTTSIAKLCAQLRKDNKTVLLGACDTFRAGAVAQLETWANRLGVEVVKGQQGGDPAAVAFDACSAAKSRNVDVLILDTAGRLQTQDPLMRQLTKIRSVIQKQIPGAPHEVLLVLDATSGQNALRQAEEFSKAAGVTGIFLAKLDGTAKGGIVIAVREVTDIPVKFVGVGETPEDVQAFEPGAFVEALFAGAE
jgi:fused signal recognition particle receptor